MKALLAMAIGLGVVASASHAQTYPAKAVRVVLPFPPGGAADTLIRPLAVKLADAPALTVALVGETASEKSFVVVVVLVTMQSLSAFENSFCTV